MARSRARGGLFARAAAIGAVVLAIGLGLIVVERPGFDVFTYWRMPISFAVAIVGLILVWVALGEAVTRIPAIDRRLGVVYGGSDRVIAMYFAPWIIVGWAIGLVGFRALDLPSVLIAMAGAVVATHYGSRLAVKLESSWWERRAPGGRTIRPELAVDVTGSGEPV
jgi:hypothetical protein